MRVIAATYYPDSCDQLILISPVALFAARTEQRRLRAMLLKLPLAKFLLYPIITSRTALRFALNHKGIPAQSRTLEADVDYLYATTHQFGAEHAPLALLAGKLAVDAEQQFASLPQPTFIIWGAKALHTSLSPFEQPFSACICGDCSYSGCRCLCT